MYCPFDPLVTYLFCTRKKDYLEMKHVPIVDIFSKIIHTISEMITTNLWLNLLYS